MRKKTTSIPVNIMAEEFGQGIAIDWLSFTDPLIFEEAKQSHRHGYNAFFLVESGSIVIEIDFQQYIITAPSIIYVHPDQIHRGVAAENLTVVSLEITNENLNAEYLAILEEIKPAKPLVLDKELFSIISETISLCLKFSKRKNDKLYHSLLKDSCNALVALVISQYSASTKPTEKISRLETVTKSFRELMERDYAIDKRPAAYAKKLNLSTTLYIMEMLTTLFRAKLTTGLADFWVAANAIKACTKIVI